MVKILVSSCLLGNNVRYNASCLSVEEHDLLWLKSKAELVIFCPEVSAGLPIPRPSAEIITGQGVDVLDGLANVAGIDVTEQFVSGAENALELCKKQQIKYAILAEGSPSCGSSKIYDGTFNGIKIDGSGVAAALLERNGINVYSQHTIAKLREVLEKHS
ncbi:purine nucleoside phosphorylase [Vibrio astriarenae]|nr:purine nucleoside phosphorylase [Vibrio sp. C7]